MMIWMSAPNSFLSFYNYHKSIDYDRNARHRTHFYHSTITTNRSILIKNSSPNLFLPFYNYHKSIDFCLTFSNPVLFSILRLTTICYPPLFLNFLYRRAFLHRRRFTSYPTPLTASWKYYGPLDKNYFFPNNTGAQSRRACENYGIFDGKLDIVVEFCLKSRI